MTKNGLAVAANHLTLFWDESVYRLWRRLTMLPCCVRKRWGSSARMTWYAQHVSLLPPRGGLRWRRLFGDRQRSLHVRYAVFTEVLHTVRGTDKRLITDEFMISSNLTVWSPAISHIEYRCCTLTVHETILICYDVSRFFDPAVKYSLGMQNFRR